MRNLENHDFGRFSKMVKNDINKINNWTSQMFFNKGATMIYAGQERCDNSQPSLFDIDKVNWDGTDISEIIKKLSRLTKDKIFSYGIYEIKITDKDVYYGQYKIDNRQVVGIFNLGQDTGNIEVDIEDGTYLNIIDNSEVIIKAKLLKLTKDPVIFWVNK